MTKGEALKMALEALEDRTSLCKWQIARDAVKEVLAQPAVVTTRYPISAVEIREFIGSNFNSLNYGREDEAPSDDDRYSLSVHDLLSAAREWEEYAVVDAFIPHPVQPDHSKIDGFCYSYTTKDGTESMFVPSFGKSRRIALQRLKSQNSLRLEPVKAHKRYKVQILILEEV